MPAQRTMMIWRRKSKNEVTTEARGWDTAIHDYASGRYNRRAIVAPVGICEPTRWSGISYHQASSSLSHHVAVSVHHPANSLHATGCAVCGTNFPICVPRLASAGPHPVPAAWGGDRICSLHATHGCPVTIGLRLSSGSAGRANAAVVVAVRGIAFEDSRTRDMRGARHVTREHLTIVMHDVYLGRWGPKN